MWMFWFKKIILWKFQSFFMLHLYYVRLTRHLKFALPRVTDSCSTPLEHRGAAVSQTKDALHLLRSLKTTAMVPVQTRIKCLCSPGCCNKTLDTVLFAMRKVYWCTVMRITRNDSIIWTAMELDYNKPTSQVDSVHRHHIGHRSSYNNIVLCSHSPRMTYSRNISSSDII